MAAISQVKCPRLNDKSHFLQKEHKSLKSPYLETISNFGTFYVTHGFNSKGQEGIQTNTFRKKRNYRAVTILVKGQKSRRNSMIKI